MKSFNRHWEDSKKIIKHSSRILLALDFDGTLTPIRPRPKDVVLNPKIKELILRLNKKEKITVAIISGRSLKDIRKLVGIDSLIYSGNHGFEIKGPKVHFIHPAYTRFRPALNSIKDSLLKKIRTIKGIVFEDKKLTLSLHYRLVSLKKIPLIRKIIKDSIRSFKNRVKVTQGKKVFEIRPVINWDKGKALKTIEKLLRKKSNDLTIYMGDDKTDNDAFQVMRGKDISVFVGKNKTSSAKYYLKDTKQVQVFLNKLLALE